MANGGDFERIITVFLILVIAITIHEFAHAISADRLGDPTPRSQGRISLNPVDHLDPLGTVFMIVSLFSGFGLGWGRPVLTNPNNFRHPVRDMMIVAVCGPLSNLLQAVVCAGVIHLNDRFGFYGEPGPIDTFMQMGVQINLGLMFFNLIPVPPLDGAKVLVGLLPPNAADLYTRTIGQFGLVIFMLLIVTGATSHIIGPGVNTWFHFLADQR